MAIGNRQLLTPEWAFWHRETVAGSMMCRVEVTNVTGADTKSWKPSDGFADQPSVNEAVVYRGIARIQPNKDWRARKQKFETEQVVEHAYRVQLSFDGNEIGEFPYYKIDNLGLRNEDRVRVIEVASLRGVLVDPDLMKYTYVIRNVQTGSNYWVRTLLCDVLLDG